MREKVIVAVVVDFARTVTGCTTKNHRQGATFRRLYFLFCTARPPTSLLAMKAVTMAIQYRHGMSAGDEGNTMAWCIRWKMGWSSR